MSATHELRESEKKTLRYIESEGECRRREISEATGYSTDTIGENLRRLKDRGLVESRPDPTFPRADLYRLSDEEKQRNTEV